MSSSSDSYDNHFTETIFNCSSDYEDDHIEENNLDYTFDTLNNFIQTETNHNIKSKFQKLKIELFEYKKYTEEKIKELVEIKKILKYADDIIQAQREEIKTLKNKK